MFYRCFKQCFKKNEKNPLSKEDLEILKKLGEEMLKLEKLNLNSNFYTDVV
jgi:hypothetical protein